MLIYFYWFLLFFFLIIAFISLYFTFIQLIYFYLPNRIGLAFSDSKVINLIEKIIEDYHLKNINNFIESGSGTGFVVRKMSKIGNFKKYIGVEVDWLIIFMSRIFSWLEKSKVSFIRKDIFDYKIPQNSLVYCYFTSDINTNLYKKGKFQNMVVICLTFEIERCFTDKSF